MNQSSEKSLQQPQPQDQPQPPNNLNEIKLKIKQKPVEPWVIQDIIQNNNLHPTKDWNDQFYQDLHRTILNAEMKDTKALGSILGVAVVGLLGFALSFTVIGFVVGSILGVIMGGYAGKRIKRKNSKFKSLIHFDLFMINVACYYGVLYDEIIRNKGSIQLNNFRFKIQKCLQEYRGVETFSKLSDSRQKGFRSEMVRLMKILQCQEAFKAMYLIYKLTKTIIQKTEKSRTPSQQYEIQVMLITVVKPLITVMQICDSKLNYDQKYLLQKLEKLAYSYDCLLLYDKLPQNLILDQKEFLLKMDRKVNVEELKNNFKAFDLDKMVLENQQKNQDNPNKKQINLIDLIQEQYEQAEKNEQQQSNLSSQKKKSQDEQSLQRKFSDDTISCSSVDSDDIQAGTQAQHHAKKQHQEVENIYFSQPDFTDGPNHHKININMNQSNYKNNANVFKNCQISQNQLNQQNQQNQQNIKKKNLNPTFMKPEKIADINDSFMPAEVNSNFSSKRTSQVNNNDDINQENEINQNNIDNFDNNQQKSINNQTSQNNLNNSNNNESDQQIINIEQIQIEKQNNENESKFNNSKNNDNLNNNYSNSNEFKSQSKEFLLQNQQQQLNKNKNVDINISQVEITIEKNEINSNFNGQCQDQNQNLQQEQEQNQELQQEINLENQQEKAVDMQSNDMIEKTKFLMTIYDETIEQGKWKSVINKKEIEIYKKTNLESAAVMVRCHCYLKDCSAQEIFNCIYDSKDRASWDKILLGFTRIEQLNEYTDIIYSYVDPGFGVTKREWVQKRFYKFDYPKPGQITICYYSVEHPLYPKKKGYIRADSYIAGYVMENVGNDCKLFILSCNDIKGLIPKYIVNFMSARAPKDWINNLHKYIQKSRTEKNKKALK